MEAFKLAAPIPAQSRAPVRRTFSDDMATFDKRLRTDPFADPQEKRGWGFGLDIQTPAHKVLIENLRKEGVRLSVENADLQNQVQWHERRYKVGKIDVSHHKEQIRLLTNRLERMGNELADAQLFMREVDALFAGHKTQRLSRAMSIPVAEIESARLVAASGTPAVEFADPFKRLG